MSGVGDRVIGAAIVGINERDAAKVVVYFEHRGTDDDSGFIVVPLSGIYFNDGGFGGKSAEEEGT